MQKVNVERLTPNVQRRNQRELAKGKELRGRGRGKRAEDGVRENDE
jgi:hypothetical protein